MSAPVASLIFSRAAMAVAASALAFSVSAQASTVTTSQMPGGRIARSVEVPFVDLDLTTDQGVATLESRLKIASKQVCGPAERAPLRQMLDHKACMAETMSSSKRAMVTLVARAEAGDRFRPGERIAVGS